MTKEFPYFNDSDVGYIDPDFLTDDEKNNLVLKFSESKNDEKNNLKDEEKDAHELSTVLERING